LFSDALSFTIGGSAAVRRLDAASVPRGRPGAGRCIAGRR
jgi:hypothetical protein